VGNIADKACALGESRFLDMCVCSVMQLRVIKNGHVH
jgi:hypothetical protein